MYTTQRERDLPPACRIKIQNLKRHGSLSSHTRAVKALLAGSSSPAPSYAAPPPVLFMDLLKAFRDDGQAVTPGYQLASGLLSKSKADRMLWCLDQADRQIRRSCAEAAESIVLLRDDRRGRMHCRIRCTDASMQTESIYLGQSIGHEPSSIGINEATLWVYRDFCTAYGDAPAGCQIEPVFHSTLSAGQN